jgi:putative membrane protein
MKKSIVMLLAIATAVSCNKKETTNSIDQNDSVDVTVPADSGSSAMTGDSAATTPEAQGTAILSDQDKKFADAAAKGGMMEVMAGELAVKNGTNPTVKTLGEMMVKDHTKANNELKQWATANAYTLPANVDAAQQKKFDELKAKKGAEFDRAYTDQMVVDHKKTISEFKKESSSGSETSLKAFAEGKIPALEHHLMESEKAKTAVK